MNFPDQDAKASLSLALSAEPIASQLMLQLGAAEQLQDGIP